MLPHLPSYTHLPCLPYPPYTDHSHRYIRTVTFAPLHSHRCTLTVSCPPLHAHRRTLAVTRSPLHAHRYTPTVTRSPFHAHSYMPTVTRPPLHAYRHTPASAGFKGSCAQSSHASHATLRGGAGGAHQGGVAATRWHRPQPCEGVSRHTLTMRP